MKAFSFCVPALVLLGLHAMAIKMEKRAESSLASEEAEAREYPVSKVVDLLKDMLKQLEKEAEEDEDTYDKLACWCTTNDKDKTEAIAAGEAKITELTNEISKLSAASGRLSTEIKNAVEEKEANQDALDKADALRQKELAEFNEDEKDSLESLAALKAAITVIGSHHSSLLQVSRSHVAGVAATLRGKLQKHAALLAGALTPSQRHTFQSFIQEDDYFDAEPTFKQSYAPQSGQIYGILQQMKETFENNLSASQKEELAAGKAFEELKAAKELEIEGNTQVIDTKTMELKEANEDKAQAEEDLEDTKNSLAADEEFLTSLKKKCAMSDAEWEKRQKTRSEEMEAVSKAMSILNSDEAHALFSKTFNPSFMQRKRLMKSERRVEASKLLAASAKKSHNPRLATLALNVRMDAFTKVKQAIGAMIAELTKEKEDEIKKKDFCIDEFHKMKMEEKAMHRELVGFKNDIKDLERELQHKTKEIEALKEEIKKNEEELKSSAEERAEQNKQFQMTVADQRATQKVLTSALKVLKRVYGKEADALMQYGPAGFEDYEKNAGGGKVTALLEAIIADAKAMESDAARAEKEAQAAYDDFVKKIKECIDDDSTHIVNLSEDKAKVEKELVEKKEGEEGMTLELEHLDNAVTELHQQCDFILKNFEARQTARDEEIKALNTATAILSGADYGA